MGHDAHTTTVPTNYTPKTPEGLVEELEDNRAVESPVVSSVSTADVMIQLKPNYDTFIHLPDWVVIENVHHSNGTVNVWLQIQE